MYLPVSAFDLISSNPPCVQERFMWDCCGFLVIKQTMDPAWLAAANAAVDVYEPFPHAAPRAAVPRQVRSAW